MKGIEISMAGSGQSRVIPNSGWDTLPGDEDTSIEHFETKLGGHSYWINMEP